MSPASKCEGAAGERYAFWPGGERLWSSFDRSLRQAVVGALPRMHRFARPLLRMMICCASAPRRSATEFFDLKDRANSTALLPECALSCLGGGPAPNGGVFNHAMPGEFRYRFRLLAANLSEWQLAVPGLGRHCLEGGVDYSPKYEVRMTVCEVGPAGRPCKFPRLPTKVADALHNRHGQISRGH